MINDPWMQLAATLIYYDINVTETLSKSQAANIWEENAVKIFYVGFN
jgi:hypothetical protein